jgi:hypothetical protein
MSSTLPLLLGALMVHFLVAAIARRHPRK